jgi:hypothetical protein
MQHDKKPVPDWLLERLALGELDADTAADVRRRLAAEGRSVDDMMAAVATSNREILAEHGATPTVAAIRQRAARAAAAERPGRRRTVLFGLPLVLAGGVAATLMMQPWQRGSHEDVVGAREYVGIKGDPLKVYVYRHGASGDEILVDGARAARGDLLQLAYASKAGGYGVLLSIDGARKVTLHLPESDRGQAAALREGGARVQVPSSYELDDAPAFERFFLVRSQAPFSVATAMDAARALATQPAARKQSLALPPGFEQISLALDKTHAGQHAEQKEQP